MMKGPSNPSLLASASALRLLLLLLLLLLSCSPSSLAFGTVDRSDGLCACLVLPLSAYNCDEYVVQTDDGFLLGVQRVSRKGEPHVDPRKPVLLLHGILLGGDVWVLNPPEQALAFLLADAGSDVWIGNTRTTRFSYGHISYSKKDKAFWDWSVDELAEYDLPAMLGLVQQQTSQKPHYVGYSQGSQQFLAAASEGKVSDMVDKVVLFAPIAYINDVSETIGKLAASFYLDRLFMALHIYEFSTEFRRKEVVDIICRAQARRCFKQWIALFTGENCCLNYSRRSIIDEYETQPTSTKNLVHLGQQFRHRTFAKFDYGFWGNLARYFRPTPPVYDLSRVPTGNMFVMHGGRDSLSDPKDVALLVSQLSGQYQYPIKFIPEYAHIDFILATNAKVLAYDLAMEFLQQS